MKGEDVIPWDCCPVSSKKSQDYSRRLLVAVGGIHGSKVGTVALFEPIAL